jgi:hypothetical protein
MSIRDLSFFRPIVTEQTDRGLASAASPLCDTFASTAAERLVEAWWGKECAALASELSCSAFAFAAELLVGG